MRYIRAPIQLVGSHPPDHTEGELALFLAGGMGGWRDEVARLLADTKLVLLDPIDYDASLLSRTEWEHFHLQLADAILFWFPHETLCPMALYELGAWSMTEKPIFVGAHPKYEKRQEMVVQTGLGRPGVRVTVTLESLAMEVLKWQDQTFSLKTLMQHQGGQP